MSECVCACVCVCVAKPVELRCHATALIMKSFVVFFPSSYCPLLNLGNQNL